MQSRSRKSSRGVQGSGVMLGGDRCSILGGDKEIEVFHFCACKE